MSNPKWFTASAVGKAGEYAVASQLILRGEHVYFPACDYGVDLMTKSGCRIQVKTAHLSATPKMIAVHGEGVYVFPLPKTKRLGVAKNRSVLKDKLPLAETCDVVVFWGVEQNRFWIAPSHLCDNAQVFVLGREKVRNHFFGNVEGLREMVRLGYKHHEIAAQYGMDRASITMILNRPDKEIYEPTAVSLVRKFENAWEGITEFGVEKTLSESQPITAKREVL